MPYEPAVAATVNAVVVWSGRFLYELGWAKFGHCVTTVSSERALKRASLRGLSAACGTVSRGLVPVTGLPGP